MGSTGSKSSTTLAAAPAPTPATSAAAAPVPTTPAAAPIKIPSNVPPAIAARIRADAEAWTKVQPWLQWRAHFAGDSPVRAIQHLFHHPLVGPTPTIDYDDGGGAYWSERHLEGRVWSDGTTVHTGSPFVQVVVDDSIVKHAEPTHHGDYMTASIPFLVDEDVGETQMSEDQRRSRRMERERRLEWILETTMSVWFDRLGQVLYVRCHSLDSVMATLALAIQAMTQDNFARDRLATDEARRATYATMMMSVVPGTAAFQAEGGQIDEPTGDVTRNPASDRFLSMVVTYVLGRDRARKRLWQALRASSRR